MKRSCFHLFPRKQSSIHSERIILNDVTGNIDVDGLHRFELDWLETAQWTKDLLLSMQNDRNALQKMAKTFVPPSKLNPICLNSRISHLYDFSLRPTTKFPVDLMVKVDDLSLKSEEMHKFLILVGDLYDPTTRILKLSRDAEHSDNAVALSTILDDLIKEAKVKFRDNSPRSLCRINVIQWRIYPWIFVILNLHLRL